MVGQQLNDLSLGFIWERACSIFRARHRYREVHVLNDDLCDRCYRELALDLLEVVLAILAYFRVNCLLEVVLGEVSL
jgi:hypothetical protein